MISEMNFSVSEKANSASGERRQIKVIRPPSSSPVNILNDLIQLFCYRDLLYTLSIHRVNVRYKQSLLGFAWAILQPLSLMLIYSVIFTVITQIPTTGKIAYPVMLFSALLIWSYFSTSVTSATNGLVSHRQLVTKVYFPREILPLTYVVAGLFDLVIATPVLLGLMVYYKIPVSIHCLWAIPIVLIMTIFIAAAALVLSAIQVRFRDIGMAMPLILQLWMFASPVVYPLSAVPARFRVVYMMNPLAGVIENFRRVLLESSEPNYIELAISASMAAILLPLAYLFFKRIEATVADVI